MLGLAETLGYIREIGRDNLIENAQLLARATREAAMALDLELFAKGTPAGAITAARSPSGIDSGTIVKQFREQFGTVIANGQGSMKGQIFRIAHLGYFDVTDLFGVIAELEIILDSLGRPVEFGLRRSSGSRGLPGSVSAGTGGRLTGPVRERPAAG